MRRRSRAWRGGATAEAWFGGLLLGALAVPAIFLLLHALDGVPRSGTGVPASAGMAVAIPVALAERERSGTPEAARLASLGETGMAAARQRFDVAGPDALGYALGKGFSHRLETAIGGTRCAMGEGGLVIWHRDAPGGAACRVTLFDGVRLAAGWRIEEVALRLGYGAEALPGEGMSAGSGVAAHGSARLVVLRGARAPAAFSLAGRVPLAGARHWAAIERIRLSGPSGALDWRTAFAAGPPRSAGR